ncbi:MAG: sulfotransferase [Solirubrobacterales bacterium]|nr:sulfotransferase [Solirubrobacterales bacterium]
MLPNFFVIGAGQSGTTSLHRYLGLHPQVQVSEPKEPNFFCREQDGPWPFGRVGDRAAYEALFDPEAAARGDCSPSYSQHPLRPGVPDRIAELVPEARLIYMVRDPIDRIVAHYVHSVSSVGESRPFAEALGDLDDRFNPYVIGSSYATQLERFLQRFPDEAMLVVDSHELRLNRLGILRRVFGFLGVDPRFSSAGFSEELNVGSNKRIHSEPYAKARDSRLGGLWRQLVPPALRRPISDRARRASAPAIARPQPDAKLRGALAERLRPETRRLRELTGETFSAWSI